MTKDRGLTDRELERDRQNWSKHPSQQLFSSLGKYGQEIGPLSIKDERVAVQYHTSRAFSSQNSQSRV